MLGGADNSNGELPSYITGADKTGVTIDSVFPADPYKGCNGRVEGTRELVIHPHFVLVYEVDSQWGKVYILRSIAYCTEVAIEGLYEGPSFLFISLLLSSRNFLMLFSSSTGI